ncbi:SpaA isopeptide-forming pilin-related protein [Bifidobacterium sp.]|uniref:SpaA isopeptide-forming pilin-related protein n=1 Tax=Bifidobacterium sp. TaxID=41200 RepID=UPI00257F3028|nr:SpaA isopeptide-forming pilin-related protein [Bifidobacterium sp.]
MMATVAITSLIPAYNAKADENNLEDGSKCTPTSYTLGDASGTADGEDTGVATYVGRDLYVGKNTSNRKSISNENDVDGSYAVEAEGLTVVNGKLVMKPLKDSWKAGSTSAGFRWGTVGFGSQFRPGDGKTVLAIGGTYSGIDTLTSGGVQGNVGAYVKGGFVGQSYAQWNGDQPAGSPWGYKYKASIAGDDTKWSSNTLRSSIVATQGDWTNPANGDVTFNASNPLKNVNGTDYSAYGTYIQKKLSEPLSKIQATGTVAIGVASEGSIDRHKYNYGEGNTVSYRFTYNDTSTTVDGNNNVENNEKLITFKGDGVSAMQVFNIKDTDLSSAGYRGVDFKFVKIPDKASVVINVDGSDIDFHTGWRFWWGDTEIGDGFSRAADADVRKLYSSAAQKIMWNFKNATKVIIRGGVANEGTSDNKLTTDDPAAAMLGSILVPNGSFESHVSTNGRVYVGQDFMMYNPTAIGYESTGAGWEGKTASVLNMDQERHNLPWNGQMIANCPAIQWNKANSAGEALEGTTWKVYGTLEAAKAGTPSLGTITDGEFTDGNDDDGIIKFEGIERNAKYFVKEFATNSTEYTRVNPYIYQINTGDDENTHKKIVHVFNSEGNEITGTNADKKLTDSDQIINEKEGAALGWSKVDGADPNKILSGSEWQLQKNDSHKAYQITDSTKAVSAVTIQYDGAAAPSTGIPLTYNVPVNLTAIVTDTDNGTDGVPQAVKWTSSDPTVASVNNGTVLGLKNGSATITACSVADNKRCATANITVTGAPSGSSAGGGSTTTGSFTISGDTHEVELNKTITLTATPTPSSGTVTWYSGDTSVASVTAGPDTTTTIKGLKAGTTTITAKTSSGATASITITVKDDSTINVYFKKSTVNWGDGNYYLHYQPKTGTSWPAVKMTDAGDCSDYVVASIPKVDVVANHGYYFRNGVSPQSSGWYNSNGQNTDGEPFAFWDGTYTDMYVNTNSDKQRGKPRGCSVTSSAAKVKARVSAAMLKSNKTDVIAVNDAEGSGTSAAPIVYSCGDALGKCDMNTEPGKFRVVDLADGTYTLTETVVPNGYTAGGSYTVTIADGMATITDASGNTIADNKIPNARNTGAISWNKVSSDPANDKKLGGSEWKLTKTESFGWNTNGVAQYTAIDKTQQSPVTITDCKSGTGKTCSAPAEGQKIYDVDPVEGQFKLTGLEWGTYTLVETKAPDGYDVDSTVRTFTFGPVEGSDVTGNWNSNSVAEGTADKTGAFTTADKTYDSDVFNFAVGGIKNQPGVVLPATGGTGNSWIYAAALVAALIGVVAAGMALKVRRRQ